SRAGRRRQPREPRRGISRVRAARVPRLHQARRVARPHGARCAAERTPRPRRRVAPRTGARTHPNAPSRSADGGRRMTGLRAAVITVSDRSAAGERADAAGPIAAASLREAGYDVAAPAVVPDGSAAVASAIRQALASGARLVITSGGTGIAPRDETPEGTRSAIDREIPGIGEELRRIG